jgi:hypothetical protein
VIAKRDLDFRRGTRSGDTNVTMGPARRLRLVGAALASTLVLSVAGCAGPKVKPVDFSESRRDYRSKDYQDVYGRWTRHGKVMRDLDAALEVWATFKSWDYRQGYIEHYAEIYGLTDTDRNALRTAQLESFRTAYEFHLTSQSANYKWNDLEKKSSAWRISLIDALGNELTPEYVKSEKFPDIYEREFFPAKTPFTRTFSVRFPLPPPESGSTFVGTRSGSIVLRFSGPFGRVDLVWRAK